MVAAYVELLAAGPDAPAARRQLALSYEGMPYQVDAAPWRLQLAVAQWPLLSERTRQNAVNEAIWYAALSADKARMVTAILGDTDLAYQFLLRRRWVGIDRSTDDAGSVSARALIARPQASAPK